MSPNAQYWQHQQKFAFCCISFIHPYFVIGDIAQCSNVTQVDFCRFSGYCCTRYIVVASALQVDYWVSCLCLIVAFCVLLMIEWGSFLVKCVYFSCILIVYYSYIEKVISRQPTYLLWVKKIPLKDVKITHAHWMYNNDYIHWYLYL